MDAPPSNPVQGALVVGKTYDLTLWIVQKVEKFPKPYRFSVGQHLIDTALDLLLLLVEAAYRRDSATRCGPRASAPTACASSCDPRPISSCCPSHAFAAEHLDEVGRMIDGWERSIGCVS